MTVKAGDRVFFKEFPKEERRPYVVVRVDTENQDRVFVKPGGWIDPDASSEDGSWHVSSFLPWSRHNERSLFDLLHRAFKLEEEAEELRSIIQDMLRREREAR